MLWCSFDNSVMLEHAVFVVLCMAIVVQETGISLKNLLSKLEFDGKFILVSSKLQ